MGEAELLAALERGASGQTAPLAATELRDGIREYKLPNGLRVVVKPNHSVPLVSLRLAFKGGLLAENEKTEGITSFISEMLTRGTTTRSSAQFATDVENMRARSAASRAATASACRATSGRLAGHRSRPVRRRAANPAFEPDEIEAATEGRGAAPARDNLGTQAFELFQQSLYPAHPYRFSSIGTAASLEKVDRASLAGYWAKLAQPENGVLAVVGDVDPDRVVEQIRAHFADWKDTGAVTLPARTAPSAPAKAKEATVVKKKNQSHIVYGFLGLSIDDPDLAALDVLTQVLGGQGGRLFVELRDKQSLAYSVTAFEMEGVDPGTFAVYMAGDPAKLDPSLDGIRTELAKIVNEPVGDEELSRAKGYLIGTQAVAAALARRCTLDDPTVWARAHRTRRAHLRSGRGSGAAGREAGDPARRAGRDHQVAST